MQRKLSLLVLVTLALAGCGAEPDGEDRDEDGLTDVEEQQGWDVVLDLQDRRVQRHVTSDRSVRDTDGDGLTDGYEFAAGLDPRVADSDEDGLTDCQESVDTRLAVCEDPDYEGETDGGTGTDPRMADSDPGPSQYRGVVQPFDDAGLRGPAGGLAGDGVPDGQEVSGYEVVLPDGTRKTVRTDPQAIDSDADQLEDGEELAYSTDPTDPDTDGDGCLDGRDLLPTRAAGYVPGIQTLTLAQGGTVRFLTVIANEVIHVPSIEGFTVAEGTTDVPPLDEPVRMKQCTYDTRHPWMFVQVRGEVLDDGSWRSLDVASATAEGESGGGTLSFYWNPATGMVSWSSDGSDAFPVAGGIAAEGPDGSVRLTPQAPPLP